MKIIKIIVGVLAIMSITTIFGQQDPQYTQYMYNMNVLNPAYAGSRGVTSIGILGRTQWVGIDGAPKTFTLSAHSPFGKSVGLGFSVIHDEIGLTTEDNVYADFSYTIETSEEGRFAFGLKGGVTFMDVGEFIMVENPDPLNTPIHQASPNFGAGMFFHNQHFYMGLSIPNFIETRHLEKSGGISSTVSQDMHYFLTSGYVFELAGNLKLKPSTMLKATSGAPVSVDVSLNMLVDDRFELGISHRFEDSISAMVGLQVNEDFRIGYAYDHTTSALGDYTSGSHEIMLLFDLNNKNKFNRHTGCFF